MKVYKVTIEDNGTEIWQNEKWQWHREGGKPAYIYNDGYMAYWENDEWHRIDGPARIWPVGHCKYPEGREEYYINGVWYSKEEFLQKTSTVKEMTVAEIEKVLGYSIKVIKD